MTRHMESHPSIEPCGTGLTHDSSADYRVFRLTGLVGRHWSIGKGWTDGRRVKKRLRRNKSTAHLFHRCRHRRFHCCSRPTRDGRRNHLRLILGTSGAVVRRGICGCRHPLSRFSLGIQLSRSLTSTSAMPVTAPHRRIFDRRWRDYRLIGRDRTKEPFSGVPCRRRNHRGAKRIECLRFSAHGVDGTRRSGRRFRVLIAILQSFGPAPRALLQNTLSSVVAVAVVVRLPPS
jgi:hypothetical protein